MNEMAFVNALIKEHGTNDPLEICGDLGHIVLEVPLIGIRGFYQYYRNVNIVYINCSLPRQVKKFVCAHELGHALMHRDMNAIFLDTRTFLKTSIYERQANQFAINLLYPDDDVFNDYRECTVTQAAQCLNVPESLLEYRIKEIKGWAQQEE